MSNRVGEYLKKLRETKGLTTRQLSHLTGYSQPYLSQIELGRRSPSLTLLWQVVSTLDGDLGEALYLMYLDADIPEGVAQDLVLKPPPDRS